MSRLRKIPQLLWNTLLCALCAYGLSGVFLAALPLDAAGFVLPLSGVLIPLVLNVADAWVPRRLKPALLLGYLALECVLYLNGSGLVHASVQAFVSIYLHFSGVTDALLPYTREIAVSFAAVFSVIGFFLSRDDAFGFACGCVFTLLVIGLYLSGGAGLVYALPVMLFLLLLMSSLGGRKLGALLLCPLIALGAYLLLPDEGVTYAPLEQAADDLRNMVEDYFFFTDTRESFSMHKAGYQPLKNRLGGTAEPVTTPVLYVEGDPNTTYYLRASSYNEYTGLNWYDTVSGRRYLFSSQVYEELRSDIFDMALPMNDDSPLSSVSVTLLRDDTTTLFTPQRLREITMLSDRMVPYFNDAGEVYITRNLQKNDRYSIAFLPLNIGTKSVRAMIRENALLHDPRMEAVSQQYLTVPGHIQEEVRQMASRITENLSSPLDKALAVRDYLKTHYDYSLTVTEPPSSVDFIAYFLLGPDQAGYCTYFASAQTILCRMAGVPARYVVGYLARTDANGTCTLSGENAHAWTEIYLNGVGWITLDATPGNQEDWEESDDSDENGENNRENQPESTPTPSPTPEVTPTPEPDLPSPSPEAEETPTPSPSPTQTPDSSRPSPSPSPSPDPGETPQPDEKQESEDKPPFPWLLLLIALLLAAIILWYHVSAPEKKAARRPDKAGDIFFAACTKLLAAMKLHRRSDETLLEFAARAQRQCGVPLEHLYAAVCAGVYGKNRRVDRRTAENALRMLMKKATRRQLFRMRLAMMFSK